METLTFHPTDVAVDATHSFFAYDPYIEAFWLPLLGPTATLLLNDLSLLALTNKSTFTRDVESLSLRVGTGTRSGSSSPVIKQLARLCQFGMIYKTHDSQYLIPRIIKPLNGKMRFKLEDDLALCHDHWMSRLHISPVDTQRRRLRSLVTRLEIMGLSQTQISATLLSTGLHPSIIGEAQGLFASNSQTSHGNTAA